MFVTLVTFITFVTLVTLVTLVMIVMIVTFVGFHGSQRIQDTIPHCIGMASHSSRPEHTQRRG